MRRQVSSGWSGDDEGGLKEPLWQRVVEGRWDWRRQMQGGDLGGVRRGAEGDTEERLGGGRATAPWRVTGRRATGNEGRFERRAAVRECSFFYDGVRRGGATMTEGIWAVGRQRGF